MVGEDTVTMSTKELRRVHVIRQVLDKSITQVKAGELLGLTDRQIRRLVRRVEQEGARGMVHRGRGKPSNRRIAGPVKTQALRLYDTQYEDFRPTFAAEKLAERDGITLSAETLRRWLRERGVDHFARRKWPLAHGERARRTLESWSSSMGRIMAGWRAAARPAS